jgi:hypothetical protein
MLKQEANKVDATVAQDLNIVLICDSRMNSFERRGNVWIITLVFSLMFHNVQFYANMHNS